MKKFHNADYFSLVVVTTIIPFKTKGHIIKVGDTVEVVLTNFIKKKIISGEDGTYLMLKEVDHIFFRTAYFESVAEANFNKYKIEAIVLTIKE
jgi:hypothetical protein